MRACRRRALILLAAAAMLCFAVPSYAALFDGPNGEIYMGDHLPQDLAEKGYVPRGAKKKNIPPSGKKSHDGDKQEKGFARVALPGKDWAIQLKTEGFKISGYELSPDGNNLRIASENRAAGMIMTVFLEKAQGKGGSPEVRAYYLDKLGSAKLPFEMKEKKTYERGPMAISEYMVKEVVEGRPIEQKSVNAYLANDGTWVDIHLSKIEFKPGDEKLFDEILDTVSVEDGFRPTFFDHFKFATAFYESGTYKSAIYHYSKVMDGLRDVEDPGNPAVVLLGLATTNNLGLSLAATGDYDRAKKLFEGAIKLMPGYPIYHYNLACLHAETGDLDGALESLGQAYKYKKNTLPGEEFPDPFSDKSFSRFAKNEKFLRAVEEFKKR